MKITDAEVIKSGEKDLIDSITADLDWGAIENIFLTEHNLGIDEDIEYKKGDIISHNNQVAYKLEFTVKVNLSVLINRDGEYLSVKISNKDDSGDPGNNNENKDEMHSEQDVEGDVAEEKEDITAGDIYSSGDNNDANGEDKYIEALEQLDSNDVGEDKGEAIS